TPDHPLSQKILETIPFLIRAAVLIALALPYLMAVALTYRPKVVARDNPMDSLGIAFQTVQFETSDHFTIRGWWIDARSPNRFDRDTVIICHGIGSEKAATLNFARFLVPMGYNVLMFDFRSAGESDGQLTSLGDLERADVLGATRWIHENHPAQSQRILG